MVTISNFENLRSYYKPDNVEVLFIGESRPQGGTFFYQENSVLYRETKKAFDEYFSQNSFIVNSFKQWDCWLYDICEEPVNGLNDADRINLIHKNIPRLVEVVKQVAPKLIIVCKKTFVEPEIRNSNIMNTFRTGENILFLSFPGNGNQEKYREGLITSLRSLYREDKKSRPNF